MAAQYRRAIEKSTIAQRGGTRRENDGTDPFVIRQPLAYVAGLLSETKVEDMGSFDQIPESVSYEELLEDLSHRSIAGLSDNELLYHIELLQRLRELRERTHTEAWWFRYYR